MKLLLANPAGLWALLGIPAVVLIHFLQERARRVRVSTLFLLDRVKPESVGGAKLERLRNSVPLWLQLLSVLIITWLLCEPRWIRQDSRQTVVVVLDSSVSMSAFQKKTRALLADKLSRWSRAAAHTDWHLLESAPSRPTLYAGNELAALLAAFDKWEPRLGTHSPDDALLTARGLLRNGAGAVIFVTDRKSDVPSDVAVLSAGEVIGNVGFAGGDAKLIERANGMKWRALVKNYGREKAEREWWIEAEAESQKSEVRGEKHKISLGAGQTVALEGEMPPDNERMTLVLSADRFAWDDRLPLQKPSPRTVRVAVRLEGAAADLIKKMFGAMDGVEIGSLTPDLVVNELGTATDTNAVQLGGSADEGGVLDPAWVAAEDHRLTRDLAWSGMLSGRPLELTVGGLDEPLLWKGGRVLALLRHSAAGDGRKVRRLILNWNLVQSNAARTPALLVMLQRFVEMVREAKREPWAGNFETGQRIEVSNRNSQGSKKDQGATSKMEMRANGETVAFDGRAPERPGFFEVLENGKTFISGAAHFADTRQADFNAMEPLDTTEERRLQSAMKQSEADPWTALCVLLLAACLTGAWAWKSTRRLRITHRSSLITHHS